MSLLSVSCLYLLVLQSENHILKNQALKQKIHNESAAMVAEKNDTLVMRNETGRKDDFEALVMEQLALASSLIENLNNDTTIIGFLRPHYFVFLKPIKEITPHFVGLWLLHSILVIPIILKEELSEELYVPPLSVLLLVFVLLKIIYHTCVRNRRPYVFSFVGASSNDWFKGAVVRAFVLCSLILEVYISSETKDIGADWMNLASSFALLLFIAFCFWTKRYATLLWMFCVSYVVQFPLFSEKFPLFCPWDLEGPCEVSIRRFVMLSEVVFSTVFINYVRF